MSRFIQILLIFCSFTSLAYAENNKKHKPQDTSAATKYFKDKLEYTATPMTVRAIVEGKIEGVIIDLRKKEDFDKGHIPGAINLPFDKYDAFNGNQTEFPGLSKTKTNYVYCYEFYCRLSAVAAHKFATLGYPVKEVEGGFKAWEERKYPVEK